MAAEAVTDAKTAWWLSTMQAALSHHYSCHTIKEAVESAMKVISPTVEKTSWLFFIGQSMSLN